MRTCEEAVDDVIEGLRKRESDLFIFKQHSRLPCLKPIKKISAKGWNSISCIQIKEAIRAIMGDNTHDAQQTLPALYPPALDAQTARDLWEVRNYNEDDSHHVALQIAQVFMRKWPTRAIFQVFPIEGLEDIHVRVMEDNLQEHLRTVLPPSPKRLASDPVYREAWEEHRNGIVYAYNVMRSAAMLNRNAEEIRQHDYPVIRAVAPGLKARIDSAINPNQPDQKAKISALKKELELYANMGELMTLFDVSGPNTGYANRMEYLTALREQIAPAFLSPLVHEDMLRENCWAEYVRHKPLNRPDGSLASYTRGT